MKKICFIIICFFALTFNIKANERYTVTLNKCVDGDTAWFNLENNVIKARFLAIDTPESTKEIEPYGKEASSYTCEKLKNAQKIEIEYDDESDKTDKYNRHLVWVFVNDELLQLDLLKEGLAEVKYIYGDYSYLNDLKSAEEYARINKLNMWKSEMQSDNLLYNVIFFILIVGIIIIFKPNKRTTKKIINIYKKRMK